VAYLCCTSFSPPSAKFPCSKSHLGLDFLFAGFLFSFAKSEQSHNRISFQILYGYTLSLLNQQILKYVKQITHNDNSKRADYDEQS